LKILEKSSCANRELAEKYKDWVLEKDVNSRTPYGCRAVGDRLDLKCRLGFGSVQTSFKPGPRDAKITAASERARREKALEEKKGVMWREFEQNAAAEDMWQAEGEAQVQRQEQDRESEVKRREDELAQAQKEERMNALARKRQDAKRRAQEEARERQETSKELDAELDAEVRKEAKAEADLKKAKGEYQKVHARTQKIFAEAEEILHPAK